MKKIRDMIRGRARILGLIFLWYIYSHMQQALEVVQEWSNRNKMTINRNKTKDMWICFNTALSESDNH